MVPSNKEWPQGGRAPHPWGWVPPVPFAPPPFQDQLSCAPEQPSDTAQGVGEQEGTSGLSSSGMLPCPQLHHLKLSLAGARFNPSPAPSPFPQFTFGEHKGKGVNMSLTKPENPAGSFLTAYISITLLLHICIGGKSRFAWRDLLKAVTEPLLAVTVLYQHPNGTANILMGKVEWNY